MKCLEDIHLHFKSMEDKLKMPACSKWNELAILKPKLFSFVLVNTQYCRYPAQTAFWNGFEFRSTDNGKYGNITHWAEINDLGQKIKEIELDDYNLLLTSIECLEKSFEIIRIAKMKNENISMYYERIGFHISNLRGELDKLKKYE